MVVSWDEAGYLLSQGNIGAIPTDTLYGLVASTTDKIAVDRVYAAKGRDFTKPCIILIEDVDALIHYGVAERDIKQASQFWPGPVSIAMGVSDKFRQHEHLSFLLRGGSSLAFRQPADNILRGLLHETGPLIAPSANPEGAAPAQTVKEAQDYFADNVDFYVDGGERVGRPSKLIKLDGGEVTVLREG